MTDFKTFETERLFIRPTNETDAEFIFRLLNSSKWLKYIGDRKVQDIAAAKNYILERMLPQLQRLGYANYTCILKSDGTKLGTCGLYDREGVEGIDIGFAFLPEYERKGYAFESAERLKKAAFEEFGIMEINAYTTTDNISSQKLLEKLGLTVIGTDFLPNDNEELLVYQIIKQNESL